MAGKSGGRPGSAKHLGTKTPPAVWVPVFPGCHASTSGQREYLLWVPVFPGCHLTAPDNQIGPSYGCPSFRAVIPRSPDTWGMGAGLFPAVIGLTPCRWLPFFTENRSLKKNRPAVLKSTTSYVHILNHLAVAGRRPSKDLCGRDFVQSNIMIL